MNEARDKRSSIDRDIALKQRQTQGHRETSFKPQSSPIVAWTNQHQKARQSDYSRAVVKSDEASDQRAVWLSVEMLGVIFVSQWSTGCVLMEEMATRSYGMNKGMDSTYSERRYRSKASGQTLIEFPQQGRPGRHCSGVVEGNGRQSLRATNSLPLSAVAVFTIAGFSS